MSRLIVEYHPQISVRTQHLIKNEITPSMVSNDDMSGQYEIDFVREKLQEVAEQKIEDFDLSDDIKVIDELIEQGVHYIEI